MPSEQDYHATPRDRAAMPDERLAQMSWLLVDGCVLISPFKRRKGGPTVGEALAIQQMQQRLKLSRLAIWIDPRDGRQTPQEIASGVLAAKARANTTVRLRQ